MTDNDAGGTPRVLVVGSGWRFTSGISYYTCRLSNALAGAFPTDALLMRQIVPTVLYPGRRRVGQVVNDLHYADDVEVYDGVDWHWGPSMSGAVRFVKERQPDVVVLQWWTGAVLHSYLRLARLARRRGARVIMEWHEVQDTGEIRIPGVRRYVRTAMRHLLRQVDAHVVHSTYDLDLLQEAYGGGADGITEATVVPHGPYDHVRADQVREAAEPTPLEAAEPAPDEPFHLLFFGVIRPYKGLEDLVAAFSALPDEARGFDLTIVGETWEGWDAPLDAVASSPARERIHVVNRYVTDAEAQAAFAAADAVVLPYRRSSSSGPLHMAMSAGLPVVVTSVGGLVEASAGYQGVRFVPPADVETLSDALSTLPSLKGRRYVDVRSWDDTVTAYRDIITGLGLTDPGPTDPARTDPALTDEPTRPIHLVGDLR